MLLKSNKSMGEEITDQFIWRYPAEYLEVGTELLVHESQQAIFLREGKAVGVLGPGRHKLDDTKLTFLQNLGRIFFKKKYCFECEIYFINHSVQMDMKWGTRERVNALLEIEPGKQAPLSIGASGSMNLQSDPNQVMVLLNYLVGMHQNLDSAGVKKIFSSLMATTIRSYLAKVLEDQHMLVFALDRYLDRISEDLLVLLKPEFKKYGLILREFYVTTLALPEDNPTFQAAKLLYHEHYVYDAKAEFRRKSELDEAKHDVDIARLKGEKALIEAQTRAQSNIYGSQAEQARRSMEGITSFQEHQFEAFNHLLDANVEMSGKPGRSFVGGEGGQMQGVHMGNPASMASDVMQTELSRQMVKGMDDIMKSTFGQMSGQQGQSSGRFGGSAAGWICSCGNENPQDHAFCGKCGQARRKPAETWTCICGGENPASNRFCGKCGKPRPAQQKTEWICSCGKVNSMDSNFCGGCGRRREA